MSSSRSMGCITFIPLAMNPFSIYIHRSFWLVLLTLSVLFTQGQDSSKAGRPRLTGDTLRTVRAPRATVGNMRRPERRKLDYFRDTIHRERRKFDSTLFTKISDISTSDYAEDLGKVYQLLNGIPGITGSFTRLPSIQAYMDEGDSALDLLKDRLYQSDRTFNVRNLEMFNTLLDALDRNTDAYAKYLEQYDTALDKVRANIAVLQKDTLMLHIFRDTALKAMFQPQLLQLKAKWRQVDSLVTENGKQINTLKSQASAHAITIEELLFRVDQALKAVGSAAFEKERHYLWESDTTAGDATADEFKYSIQNEWQLARIYFANTNHIRNWLGVLGIAFFAWIWWNYRSLRRLQKLEVLTPFDFHFIGPVPVIGMLVFIFSLAPLFDLHAPSIYIELIQFGLILVLTIYFRQRLSRILFFYWTGFVVLLLCLLATRILGLPLDTQRWILFVVDACAVAGAFVFLLHRFRQEARWLSIMVAGYGVFNLVALACNAFGRVTLSQILSYTAVYSVAQTMGLGIFVGLMQESFLLQIETSRTRKAYPEGFDYRSIAQSIRRVTTVFAAVLWLIVFTTNLNLLDAVSDGLTDVFTSSRQVGNFSFTLGGIVLFLGIIWLANFLQKYIAYFFGDTGDDSAFDDKGQRSRLMITRLIFLIGGFLLAVAASGLPVDRITVILGALGVGVGLGLQNIVNNFVSGIILIFDRPLRIGDTVELGDKRGRVKEIGIRTSTLMTEEGAEVIIPNGDVLSHNIINWTLSNNHVRGTLTLTIEKPAGATDLTPEMIEQVVAQHENVTDQRAPEVQITTINSKSLEMKILFWVKDFSKSTQTTAAVRAAVFATLEQKGLTVL